MMICQEKKNVTLFIDTIYNQELTKRYPKIEEERKWQRDSWYRTLKNWEDDLEKDIEEGREWLTEEIIKKKKANYKILRRNLDADKVGNNPIIIIGYIEENIINSMYLVNQAPIGIDDIHYEMYYFYKHS